MDQIGMNRGADVVDCLVVVGSKTDASEVLKLLREDRTFEAEMKAHCGAVVAEDLLWMCSVCRDNSSRLLECEGRLSDVLERSWEMLHTGDWKAVAPCWRSAYAVAALLLGHLHSLRGSWKEATRLFDLVLLMGTSQWHRFAHAALANAPVDVESELDDGSAWVWPNVAPLQLPPALDRWPRLKEYHTLPSLNEFESNHLIPSVPCIFKGGLFVCVFLPV